MMMMLQFLSVLLLSYYPIPCLSESCDTCELPALLYNQSATGCAGIVALYPVHDYPSPIFCVFLEDGYQVPVDSRVRLFGTIDVCHNGTHFCGVNNAEAGQYCTILSRKVRSDLCFTCSGKETELSANGGAAIVLLPWLPSSECIDSPMNGAILISGSLSFPIMQTTSNVSEGCIGAVCNNGSDGGTQPTNTDSDESVGYPENECYLIQSSFEERFNVCGGSFNGPCVDFCVVNFTSELLGGEEFSNENVDLLISITANSTITLEETLATVQHLFTFFNNHSNESIRYIDASRAKAIFRIFDVMVSKEETQWLELVDVIGTASDVLRWIEQLLEYIAQAIIAGTMTSFEFYGNNIEIKIESSHSENTLKGSFIFPNIREDDAHINVTSPVRVQLPEEILCGTEKSCSTVPALAFIGHLPRYLSGDMNRSNVASDYLVSIQVFGVPDLATLIINHPVVLSFVVQNEYTRGYNCVSWDFDINDWSAAGVDTDIIDSATVCTTRHLTGFAVLLNVQGSEFHAEEKYALMIISYVGCTISIVCLFLTLFALVVFREAFKKGILIYTHMNLVIALLLALITFVAGIEAATTVPWLCTLVAALLHYFFLCVFCWMLAEGIMLYLLVVRVFGNAAEKWYYLLILGWGLPLFIVGVSVGIRYHDYGNSNFCWISTENAHGTMWAFAGPVVAIILVNTVILIMVIASIVKSRKCRSGQNNLSSVQTAAKSAVILLPLLGLTWAFGLLAVNQNTTVFAWIFTIFNSLQGFFIFILHIVRNGKVLALLKRCIPCTTDKKKRSSFSSTTAISGMRTPDVA